MPSDATPTPDDPTPGAGGAGDVDYRISAEELDMIGQGGDWAQTMAIRLAQRIRSSEAMMRALVAERDALRAAVEKIIDGTQYPDWGASGDALREMQNVWDEAQEHLADIARAALARDVPAAEKA